MSEDLRAVVVDDERLARVELRALLAEHPVTIVGEADSLESAAAVIEGQTPDLVFLDIQLGHATGFDLLPRLDDRLAVIFVTGYQEHALRAFEVNALDYLLKPVSPDRLASALARIQRGHGSLRDAAPCEAGREPLAYNDHLFLRLDHKMGFLRVDTIDYISAAGDYSIVHSATGEEWMVEKPLREWQDRLPERHFVRIRRSTIINISSVERVEPWTNHSYRVFMRGNVEPLIMSRRYANKAKSRLR